MPSVPGREKGRNSERRKNHKEFSKKRKIDLTVLNRELSYQSHLYRTVRDVLTLPSIVSDHLSLVQLSSILAWQALYKNTSKKRKKIKKSTLSENKAEQAERSANLRHHEDRCNIESNHQGQHNSTRIQAKKMQKTEKEI